MSTDGIKPFKGAAGGWPALGATASIVKEQGAPVTTGQALLKANQPRGFDCPGCAWPDPKHTSSFEFCENGAKAVAWETTSRTVTAEFFAAHTVTELRAQSDHWLEDQGRLTHPLRYDAASDRYVPVTWGEAAQLVARHLQSLPTPDAAAFYTSGRTSNEAAFLYQLFAREYGTNNMPDCSNMCHEATSIGLPQSLGVGKGTVQLADFETTDLLLSFGHNPGTNHPRMLTSLRSLRKRGAQLIVFNPLRERGLERFVAPQHPVEMLSGHGTELATQYVQLRVGSDPLALQALMKLLLEWERARGAGDPPVIDRQFIEEHTTGFDELVAQLDTVSWDEIVEGTGVARSEFESVAREYVQARSVIIAYGMGITQHIHGTQNVQQIANLLLLRGNIGRPGAGICPVRGHSNVQGDRTVGINERPTPEFLDRLEATFGFSPPRHNGHSVVECIEAIRAGTVRVLIAMGGNFAVAAPDPKATGEAMAKLALYVGINTKLNRSHLMPRGDALILPALGRSDLDIQGDGPQSVTVEDSMSMVHASHGFKAPPSAEVRSEPAIVAALATATLPRTRIDWNGLVRNYDRIRDLIEKIIPGFEQYNERIRVPGGFHLVNPAAQRIWKTPGGRARFMTLTGATQRPAATLPLLLTTVRSHDQYNTTIYGMNDRYRGIQGHRDVVFMNADDMKARGIATGDAVTVRSAHAVSQAFIAVPYPVATGSCAAYYPEANVLVALLMAATQRPVTQAALDEPASQSAWKDLPSWFIYGDKDLNIPPQAMAFMATRASARRRAESWSAVAAPSPVCRSAGDELPVNQKLRTFRSALLSAVMALLACSSVSYAESAADSSVIRPFKVHVAQSALDDLRARVQATRWPDKDTVADDSQGLQLERVQLLAKYWASDYDWRRLEREVNTLPQFVTTIDGVDIHFIHVKSKHPNALPLIITHGWPGSFLEMLKTIGPLTDPTAHGGRAEDAFDIVIPSIPGYGFSQRPTETGWGPDRVGRAWDVLMKRLGYTRYVSQGGDHGSVISDAMARQTPRGLIGIHLTMPATVPDAVVAAINAGGPAPAGLSAQEQRAFESLNAFFSRNAAYGAMMVTRPQTLGYGLSDSPVGLAAWMYDKLSQWTDSGGHPERSLSRDEMLDDISLYWLTNSAVSAARFYWENNNNNFSSSAQKTTQIRIPVAITVFPGEIYRAPESWARRAYPTLYYFHEASKGGHFAAWEEPQLFAEEVRAAFRSLH